MKPLKYRLFVIFLGLFVVFGAVQAQEEGAQTGESWWRDSAMWDELNLELTPRVNWCDELDIAEPDYQEAFAAGQTDAESLSEWCLQIKLAFYQSALASCRTCLEGESAEPVTLICECVCATYPGEECQQCMENPDDPALLRLPHICECIVRH